MHAANSTQTTATKSVSATSEKHSTIQLFVGSAPVNYENQTSVGASERITEQSRYSSTILMQTCKHFSSVQKCYCTPWKVRNVHTDLSVNCSFDMDGTVPKAQLERFFIMNWSRQAAPSSFKWTRDVHDSGNNTPGMLKLSIPFVLLTSNRNVSALVSILDNHIETFMRLRSTLHSSSSFK